jgi:hypothetical protein
MYLTQAQQALIDALAHANPKKTGQQSNFQTDLACTYILQNNIEQAHHHLTRAVELTLQVKSQVTAQRIFKVRQELEPWQDTQYVKNLDEQMEPLLTPGWYKGSI